MSRSRTIFPLVLAVLGAAALNPNDEMCRRLTARDARIRYYRNPENLLVPGRRTPSLLFGAAYLNTQKRLRACAVSRLELRRDAHAKRLLLEWRGAPPRRARSVPER